MSPLIGKQLALLPGVEPYPISSPAACVDCLTTGKEQMRGLIPYCSGCKWQESQCKPIEDSLSPEHLVAANYQNHSFAVAEEAASYGQRKSESHSALSPAQAFHIGDEVRVLAVQPHQSKRWIGQKGHVCKLSRTRVWVRLLGLQGNRPVDLPLPVDCLEKARPQVWRRQRRHSPKGKASGWLEERQGNKKRKTPSTSYYYCWLVSGVTKKRYVPVGKVYRVNQMIEQRKSVDEILTVLRVKE